MAEIKIMYVLLLQVRPSYPASHEHVYRLLSTLGSTLVQLPWTHGSTAHGATKYKQIHDIFVIIILYQVISEKHNHLINYINTI